MTLDGTWTEFLFRIAAINDPLMSVSKLNEAGYEVMFDENNSCIVRKKTKKVTKLEKRRECPSSTPTCPRSLLQVSAGRDSRDTPHKPKLTNTT